MPTVWNSQQLQVSHPIQYDSGTTAEQWEFT